MKKKAHLEADNFLNNEKQFHLGVLPTEQSNPKTQNLDLKFASNSSDGVRMLFEVDKDVSKMAESIFGGREFKEMVDVGVETINAGGKIVFSGCGATGRLSILLESLWRHFFRDLRQEHPKIYEKTKFIENSILSIMTGGDYALIRSVEYFEDYQEFGKQQVREMNLNIDDMLIAITEGGETSSVLGTVEESADRNMKVFLLFNNPSTILSDHIERSRKAINDSRITILDLYCGPMALAGSTRMQATTSEQLIAGAALEIILTKSLRQILNDNDQKVLSLQELDYSCSFKKLINELLSEKNTKTIADYINLEKEVYQANGLVTYYANEFLLDIFTDTTERSPTFMIPPFKKYDDLLSPLSWAFVKNPLFNTQEAWEYSLGRPPRCLKWDSKMYRKMGVHDSLANKPPLLDEKQILKFRIGCEEDYSRFSRIPNIAINVMAGADTKSLLREEYGIAFIQNTSQYQNRYTLSIGNFDVSAEYHIKCSPTPSILNLMEHMAVKLVLNTISTGTMVLMGRVTGNWMSWVEVSNKKLRDRGIRLISEICGISYKDSCYALHEVLEELNSTDFEGKERLSPVQHTINKINANNGSYSIKE